VAVLLCGITFIFGNYVIPFANLKFVTLYNDIYFKKPAFDLKEGIFFNNIPNYAIKVGKKDPDNKTIRNVLIYEQNYSPQDNVIIADEGVMNISEDKNFLEFNLKNGVRYQERGSIADTSTEYIRIGFREFKKLFDLSILQKQNTADSVFKNNNKMLSARQLSKNIDSLSKIEDSLDRKVANNIKNYFHYTRPQTYRLSSSSVTAKSKLFIPDSVEQRVHDRAVMIASEMRNTLQFGTVESELAEKELRNSRIEWHRKYSFSLACLVLFFIGAPLGSIIRRGGMGMPLVVAIIFFLIFHLLNMFGEKFVKEDLTSPFIGMWLSVIVLIPVGIFLTYKAMHDSQLFSKEFYYRLFKKIQPMIARLRQ
jgi:lipopolysaccharide export system permease protein